MKSFVRPETSDAVITIRRESNRFKLLSTTGHQSKTPNLIFFNQSKGWINCFLQLNGKMAGYERRKITPYMHIIVANIPRFFSRTAYYSLYVKCNIRN